MSYDVLITKQSETESYRNSCWTTENLHTSLLEVYYVSSVKHSSTVFHLIKLINNQTTFNCVLYPVKNLQNPHICTYIVCMSSCQGCSANEGAAAGKTGAQGNLPTNHNVHTFEIHVLRQNIKNSLNSTQEILMPLGCSVSDGYP